MQASTAQGAIRIPRVIVLQMYDRLPRTKVRFSRLNIYARDDNTCQYCAQKLPRTHLNLDHVIPRARGGRTTWENVVCCCVPCNLKKGANNVTATITSCPGTPSIESGLKVSGSR